jgi:uncharacterized protein (DUF2141 family)
MKFAAVLLIGMATAATAEAQTGPARFDFLPMPNTLPTLLFAPDPLAGKLLRPLTVPAADATAFAEVTHEPAALPVAVVQTLPEATAAELAPAPALESDAEPLPEDIGDPAAEPLPDETVSPAAEPLPDDGGDLAVAPVPEVPPEPDKPATTVTVIVENVETDSGTVNVAVCDKDLSREGCPYISEVPAHAGFVETEFQDIPPGTYAIVGYHDVNGNNLFDKLFGMPREPYALSNKAGDMLVPTFSDAALPIRSGENAVIIRLKRLGG